VTEPNVSIEMENPREGKVLRWNLSLPIVLVIILAVVFSLLGTALISLQTPPSQSHASITSEKLDKIAMEIGVQISTHFAQKITAFQGLAEDPTLTIFSREAIINHLNSWVRQHPEFDFVALFDENGRAIAANTKNSKKENYFVESLKTKNFNKETWFLGASQIKLTKSEASEPPFIEDIQPDMILGELFSTPTLASSMSYPIFDENRKLIAVITARLSGDWIQAILDKNRELMKSSGLESFDAKLVTSTSPTFRDISSSSSLLGKANAIIPTHSEPLQWELVTQVDSVDTSSDPWSVFMASLRIKTAFTLGLAFLLSLILPLVVSRRYRRLVKFWMHRLQSKTMPPLAMEDNALRLKTRLVTLNAELQLSRQQTLTQHLCELTEQVNELSQHFPKAS